jgi:hypothetical protein
VTDLENLTVSQLDLVGEETISRHFCLAHNSVCPPFNQRLFWVVTTIEGCTFYF